VTAPPPAAAAADCSGASGPRPRGPAGHPRAPGHPGLLAALALLLAVAAPAAAAAAAAAAGRARRQCCCCCWRLWLVVWLVQSKQGRGSRCVACGNCVGAHAPADTNLLLHNACIRSFSCCIALHATRHPAAAARQPLPALPCCCQLHSRRRQLQGLPGVVWCCVAPPSSSNSSSSSRQRTWLGPRVAVLQGRVVGVGVGVGVCCARHVHCCSLVYAGVQFLRGSTASPLRISRCRVCGWHAAGRASAHLLCGSGHQISSIEVLVAL
jgi:hypothetical protein